MGEEEYIVKTCTAGEVVNDERRNLVCKTCEKCLPLIILVVIKGNQVEGGDSERAGPAYRLGSIEYEVQRINYITIIGEEGSISYKML